MTTLAIDSMLDALDVKLVETFGGRVVRKDLVKKTKVGFNIPVYVLEYLLGRYCSSTDPSIVAEGLEHVKTIIAERFVRADEGELIKSRTRERGSMRLIDKVTVAYRETEDKYWATLANSGLVYVHIASSLVQQYEKLLVGGVWANVEIRYDDTLQHRGVTRPFVIEQLQPIQIASADLDEYIDGRRHFTRDEWLDVLFRSIGYEPGHADFTFRRKLLYLLRLVPLVEHNYNLVELGPRGTGKSFVYREISPYVILVSGGQVTVPKLFIENSPPYRIGLVGVWDVVAFDEVAGSQFRRSEAKQVYKDYMEMGSFSRGSGKGTIPAYASFVFNGNIDGDVETRARTSHLFTPFPETIRYDMAFHDRWHAYLPGWELPKMQPEYFTSHLGFIVDYMYDYLRANLRRLGSDRDLKDFDLHVQIHSLMQAREGTGIGVGFFIALLSAVLARPLMPQLVILGDLTIHGVLMRVDSLADKLKIAMDAGAKKVMIPTENKRDFADLPADIIDKLQIVFYSDPTNAPFRAMGLE